MAALTSVIIAIAGLTVAWLAVEIACKPFLDKGREAIDRALDPDYDPDLRSAPSSLLTPTAANDEIPRFLGRILFPLCVMACQSYSTSIEI